MMTHRAMIIVLLISILAIPNPEIHAQSVKTSPQMSILKKISVGGHPQYSRILIELDSKSPYRIKPNYQDKTIILILPQTTSSEGFKTRAFKDNHIESIENIRLEDQTQIVFHLNRQNTRLFHFFREKDNTIILDFEGLNQPLLKASTQGKPDAPSKTKAVQAPKTQPPPPSSTQSSSAKKKAAVPSLSKEKIQRAKEILLKNGQEDYRKILAMLQEKLYEEAIEAIDQFPKDYPESRHLGELDYLKADAVYKLASAEESPLYDETLELYLAAMRAYPKERLYDHAMFRVASLYDAMGLSLEAKTLYLAGINDKKNRLYDPARKIALAQMLFREEKFDEALKAYQLLLKKDSKNEMAQAGLFKIAKWHYDQGNLPQAKRIFEEASQRWPDQLEKEPWINFYLGEIYFNTRDFEKARKHYFLLVNLDPEAEIAHISLNRIGDSYLIENNGMAALSVFDRSRRMKEGSEQSQYGEIRLADIGIREPTLPIKDIVFDLPPYFDPLKTYEDVYTNAKSESILVETVLSLGSAHLKQRRYLDAIRELKKLVALGPDSPFQKPVGTLIRQALSLLIDDYSLQKGHLPALYAYSDYMNLGLGDIENIKTMIQVGESFQAIGMNAEALKFYERVKLVDIQNIYRDRLFLNLAKIHLHENNFKEAEIVALTFLNQSTDSPKIPDGLKTLAKSYEGQNRPRLALNTYQRLLDRPDVDLSEVHFLIGDLHYKQGDIDQAIREYLISLDLYDRILSKTPEYIRDTHYKLGIALHQNKKYDKALDALKAARQLFPTHNLNEWAEYLISDCYDHLQNRKEEQDTLKSLSRDNTQNSLLRQAAASRLKILDWEKRFVDPL